MLEISDVFMFQDQIYHGSFYIWEHILLAQKECLKNFVLYGRGSCTVLRRLVYCTAARETLLCMAKAHCGRGFHPSLDKRAGFLSQIFFSTPRNFIDGNLRIFPLNRGDLYLR